MKLMLHELRAAIINVAQDEPGSAFKKLARVSKIMEQLVHAWDVLATMTSPNTARYGLTRPTPAGFRARRWHRRELFAQDAGRGAVSRNLETQNQPMSHRGMARRNFERP